MIFNVLSEQESLEVYCMHLSELVVTYLQAKIEYFFGKLEL